MSEILLGQLVVERPDCLFPLTQAHHALEQKSQLTSSEADLFHQLHRVTKFAATLGKRIADYQDSEDFARDAGLSVEHLELMFRSGSAASTAPAAALATGPTPPSHPPPSRSRSPRPSSSTRRQQRVGGATLIRPREAADDLLQAFGIEGGHSEQIALALLDFHGVIDLDWEESCSIVRTLSREGIYIGCLSFGRDPDTIEHARSYVDQLAQETRVTIPVVITPRRVIRKCKTSADWCKSEFLEQLPVGEKFWACFIDDKWEIINDCRRVLTGSQFVRLIRCNQGLRRAIEQWEGRVKGTHQLVIGSEYTLRIIP